MNNYTKENLEKAKVFKKLMRKWLTTQETEKKAILLLEKNAILARRKTSRS